MPLATQGVGTAQQGAEPGAHIGEGDGGDAAVVGELRVGVCLAAGVVELEDRLPLAAAGNDVAKVQGGEGLHQAQGLGRPGCGTRSDKP